MIWLSGEYTPRRISSSVNFDHDLQRQSPDIANYTPLDSPRAICLSDTFVWIELRLPSIACYALDNTIHNPVTNTKAVNIFDLTFNIFFLFCICYIIDLFVKICLCFCMSMIL